MVPGLQFEKNSHNRMKDEIMESVETSSNEKELIKMIDDIKNKYSGETNIQDNKMSSSVLYSKIDLLDSKKQINKKIGRSYCFPGEVDDNSAISILRNIIFPIMEHKCIEKFVINRSDKYGGKIIYENLNNIINDFKSEKLHPSDLKLGIVDYLNSFLEPIRNTFDDKNLQHLINMAYNDKYFNKNK